MEVLSFDQLSDVIIVTAHVMAFIIGVRVGMVR